MPTLSDVSSTADLATYIGKLFTVPFVPDVNTPNSVVLRGDIIMEFEGTGLAIETFFGFFFNFSAGTIETISIRSNPGGEILARLSGLEIDVVAQEEIFQGSDALFDYVASLDWTMTGTSGNDSFDLTDIAGFRASLRNVIAVDAGDDEVRGGVGVDIINGGDGNDTIIDSKGNDVAYGKNDDDVFSLGAGANGNDRFYGNGGNDIIQGGSGKDRLFGGADDDEIYGGSKKDQVTGGSGNDTMAGGAGDDTFIFAASDGIDVISDFDLAADTIRITADSATIGGVEGAAVIRYGSSRITLEGIDPDDLVIGDHILLV